MRLSTISCKTENRPLASLYHLGYPIALSTANSTTTPRPLAANHHHYHTDRRTPGALRVGEYGHQPNSEAT
jgi:hypothetical protein